MQCTPCPAEQHFKDSASATGIKSYRINCQERTKDLEESIKFTTYILKHISKNKPFLFHERKNWSLNKKKYQSIPHYNVWYCRTWEISLRLRKWVKELRKRTKYTTYREHSKSFTDRKGPDKLPEWNEVKRVSSTGSLLN